LTIRIGSSSSCTPKKSGSVSLGSLGTQPPRYKEVSTIFWRERPHAESLDEETKVERMTKRKRKVPLLSAHLHTDTFETPADPYEENKSPEISKK